MGKLKLVCYTDGDFKFEVDNKSIERLDVIYHEDGFIQYQEFVLKFDNDDLIRPFSFLTLLKASLRTSRNYVKKDVKEMLSSGTDYLNWLIETKEEPKEFQTYLEGNYDGTCLTITFEKEAEKPRQIDLKNSIDFLRDQIVYGAGGYKEALTHIDNFELIVNALSNGIYVKCGYLENDYKKICFDKPKKSKAIALEYANSTTYPLVDLSNTWLFLVAVDDEKNPLVLVRIDDHKMSWSFKESE